MYKKKMLFHLTYFYKEMAQNQMDPRQLHWKSFFL